MPPSLPLACQTSALLMSYAPEVGIPSRTFTSNLTLRTRPLYALSYGDKKIQTPGRSLSPAHTQPFLEALGRSIHFAFRSSK